MPNPNTNMGSPESPHQKQISDYEQLVLVPSILDEMRIKQAENGNGHEVEELIPEQHLGRVVLAEEALTSQIH